MRAISPKWSPGLRLSRSLPATETVASPDSIRKNAAPSDPSLTTVSPAEKCRSLKRSAICCNSSPLRSAKRGTRRSASTGAPAISASSCPRHRAALQQVERPAGDRPLDIPRWAVDVLAAKRQLVQLLELGVVETQPLGQLRLHLVLDGAAAGDGPNRDPL